jgi:hypothetical protein
MLRRNSAFIFVGARVYLPPKLGFPWIPLAESGLFNELREKKIKKIPLPLTRVSGCGQTPETQIFLSFPSHYAARCENPKVRLRE